MTPHIKRTEEEPPIPAQHRVSPATHYTHTRHAWEMRHNTPTMDIKRGVGVHDALATRRTEHGERTGRRLLCAPVREKTRAQKPLLGRGPSPPVWDDCLDAPGQRRRQLPSSLRTRHREVKQGKSGGSVGTTNQGKGKGSGEGKIEQGGRGRTQGCERPMGTTAHGKGSKGRAADGDRPIGAASCRREQHPWQHALPPSRTVTKVLPHVARCCSQSTSVPCWSNTFHMGSAWV